MLRVMADDPMPEFWFTDLHPDERHGLEQFLDYQRNVMLRKAHGLDAAQLAMTIHPSALSIGLLLAHLALVEDDWMQETLHGRPMPEPWLSLEAELVEGGPSADEIYAATASPEELRAVYVAAIERSREALAECDLDDVTTEENWDGKTRSVRWLYLHMIEEYARHLGHADFLRESIDGSYGD
ncbi:MAG: mini-circle protein [Acidimicrobiales bacterium]|nr:MAG: mini-circle protein [Acidimicrobiales bacterium]